MSQGANMASVLLVGIGNRWRGDDAVGIAVVEALRDSALPQGVEVIICDRTPLDLLGVLLERGAAFKKIIVVDAVQMAGPAGSVYRISLDDLALPLAKVTSGHQIGLAEALASARELGCAGTSVVVFGVQVCDLSFAKSLTSPVASAIEQVIALIRAEIAEPNDPCKGESDGLPSNPARWPTDLD